MTAAQVVSSRPPDPPEHHGAIVEAPQVRTRYVRVTNNTDQVFTDRFDGVPIRVEPGKSENFRLDEAAHIFGYHDGVSPETMLRHIAKRQGWNQGEFTNQNLDARKALTASFFDKFKIEPVTYRLVEERVDTEQPIPAELGPDELPPLRKGK